MKFSAVSTVAAVLLLLPASADAQRPTDFRPFDAYATQAMAQWKVPGVAIAIVRNDSVIHARGYGVRKLGAPEAVHAQTLFAIGSSSKAFPATSLAMLVDEGKVRWDDKATLHLPGFQLHDSYATRDLTIRDLLSHRSGLSRGDLMWYGSAYSREEILRRVRFLEPSWGFRERFGYQNIMYLASGQVAARASGMSWDDVIRTRIFQSLGMTSSSTSITALAGVANLAQPHVEIEDTVRVTQDLRAQPQGDLRITCGVAFGIAVVGGWVETFLERHPQCTAGPAVHVVSQDEKGGWGVPLPEVLRQREDLPAALPCMRGSATPTQRPPPR